MNNRKRACVIIIDNDKILLMHRIKDWKEYYAIIWGWMENWESPEQTAIREVKEETNLDVKLNWLFCEISDIKSHAFYYIAKNFSWKEKLSWPEAKRNNKDNRYELKRIGKEDLKDIPLVPEEIKDKIIEYFKL